MTTTDPVLSPPADDGRILDALQERMDRIIRGDSPNAGLFCGYCYARLDPQQSHCPLCGHDAAAVAPVSRVPRDALHVYNAHRRKMQLWVNLFAFCGIFLAIVLTGVMIAVLPNPWNFFAAITVIFSSWYLANLLGGGLGAAVGVRQGSAARAAKWQQFLARRVAGENLDVR